MSQQPDHGRPEHQADRAGAQGPEAEAGADQRGAALPSFTPGSPYQAGPAAGADQDQPAYDPPHHGQGTQLPVDGAAVLPRDRVCDRLGQRRPVHQSDRVG